MDNGATFYEETHDIGEVVYRERRYRVFFDAQRRSTGCSPIAESDQNGCSNPPIERR